MQTGIEGLDELVSGGFPKDRVILVVGGPGAGKTILRPNSYTKESPSTMSLESS